MFGKLKEHKKLVMIVVALISAAAAYLVGDVDAAAALKLVLASVGL